MKSEFAASKAWPTARLAMPSIRRRPRTAGSRSCWAAREHEKPHAGNAADGLAITIGASEPRTVEILLRERKLLDDLLLPLADDHGVRAVTITLQPHGIPASPGLSENHQSPFPESGRSGDPGANRRETPRDKEGRSSRPDTGTSVHDEHSAIRTGHPGSLVV